MLARAPRKNQSFARHTWARLVPRTCARRKGPEGRKVIAEVVRRRLIIARMAPRSVKTDTTQRQCIGPPGLPARLTCGITGLTAGAISCRPIRASMDTRDAKRVPPLAAVLSLSPPRERVGVRGRPAARDRNRLRPLAHPSDHSESRTPYSVQHKRTACRHIAPAAP